MYILYVIIRYGIPIALIVGFIVFTVWYVKAFNKGRATRQEGAVENLLRNGGRRKLEWDGPRTPGLADQEFGSLVVEIPRNMGSSAQFYEYGLVIGKKRLSYLNLKDAVVEEPSGLANASTGKVKGASMKATVRDCAKLWLYPAKGAAFGLYTVLGYQIELDTMKAIQSGLGY